MENIEDTIKFQINNNEAIIKNKELNNYIKFKLEKEDFTKEDLKNIDEIIIDSKNIIEEHNEVYFDEIELFPNLKKISIRNLGISSKNMDLLKNIKFVEFENCELWNLSKLKEVEQLIIINSDIDNIEEIGLLNNLKDLHLINMKFDNYDILKKITNLEKLTIKNIKEFSMSKIDFSLPIRYLSIEKIPNLNIDIISKYQKLEVLSVDRKEAKQFDKELDYLKEKGIRILLNDIYDF